MLLALVSHSRDSMAFIGTVCFIWSMKGGREGGRVESLSQGSLDEDCTGRMRGRQGKKVIKTGPVLRLFAHCKSGEGDTRARG